MDPNHPRPPYLSPALHSIFIGYNGNTEDFDNFVAGLTDAARIGLGLPLLHGSQTQPQNSPSSHAHTAQGFPSQPPPTSQYPPRRPATNQSPQQPPTTTSPPGRDGPGLVRAERRDPVTPPPYIPSMSPTNPATVLVLYGWSARGLWDSPEDEAGRQGQQAQPGASTSTPKRQHPGQGGTASTTNPPPKRPTSPTANTPPVNTAGSSRNIVRDTCDQCHREHRPCSGPPVCDKCRGHRECVWPPVRMGRHNYKNWIANGGIPVPWSRVPRPATISISNNAILNLHGVPRQHQGPAQPSSNPPQQNPSSSNPPRPTFRGKDKKKPDDDKDKKKK